MKNCFPQTKLLVTDGFTNALLAFRDGRADTLMWDDTVLCSASPSADPTAKLTDDLFLPLPYGIGIKQGNTALKRWVDSRLEPHDARRTPSIPILKNNVPPRILAAFAKNILRPKTGLRLHAGRDLTTERVLVEHVVEIRDGAAAARRPLRSLR